MNFSWLPMIFKAIWCYKFSLSFSIIRHCCRWAIWSLGLLLFFLVIYLPCIKIWIFLMLHNLIQMGLKFFRSPESLKWPIAMGWHPSSCVVHRALTSSPRKLLGQSLPNSVCSICRGSRPEIINFMTPHPKGP